MLRELVVDALRDGLALLSPVECAGCGAPDRALCSTCRAALIPEPSEHTVHGVSVHCALSYSGVARRALLAFKENGRTDIGPALARPLAAAVLAAAAQSGARAELTVVPSRRAALRRRGYDPVRLLVNAAGGRPTRVLIVRGADRAQKALGVVQRADNRRGAFVARRSLTGRRFIVVDDVLTTGATIGEAIRAISAAGGEVVSAACLTFTARWSANHDIHSREYYGE